MSAGFFAIGKPQWAEACSMGLNPAVAFLVLARGTGRDNSTTRWSAQAVAECTGMAWRRAHAAIAEIEKGGLAKSNGKPSTRPVRKLTVPHDPEQMLWLPNALISGAAAEVPPVTRLRQSQNLEHVQAFIELYGVQDLAGDGGLPRSLIWAQDKVREHICDTGQFTVWGFSKADDGSRYCNTHGPLARFAKRKHGDGSAWDFLSALERMGLLEMVDYLAEGDSPDAELIHALTGDAEAAAVSAAAAAVADSLPSGFQHEAEGYDYTLPVFPHLGGAAVVGVFRLVYRPHTKLTAAWYARHVDSCRRFANIYHAIAAGDYQQAVAA